MTTRVSISNAWNIFMILSVLYSEDILEQLINSLLKYYADKLLICRTDSSYVYESVEGLIIHFHKIDLNKGSSYISSPSWLKNKDATINPKNAKDNFCFMYALFIALNHKEIGKKIQIVYHKSLLNTFLSTVGTIKTFQQLFLTTKYLKRTMKT